MSDSRIEHRYRNRLLTLIAAILLIGALKAAFAVAMPIAFAAIIVAALWPLKRRLARHMPSWLDYTLTLLPLVAILGAFAAAVYLSIGQVIAALTANWASLEKDTASLPDGLPSTAYRSPGRSIASGSWRCSRCWRAASMGSSPMSGSSASS